MSSLHLSTANNEFGQNIQKAPIINADIFDFLNKEIAWKINPVTRKDPSQFASFTPKPVNAKNNEIEGLLLDLFIGSKGFADIYVSIPALWAWRWANLAFKSKNGYGSGKCSHLIKNANFENTKIPINNKTTKNLVKNMMLLSLFLVSKSFIIKIFVYY